MILPVWRFGFSSGCSLGRPWKPVWGDEVNFLIGARPNRPNPPQKTQATHHTTPILFGMAHWTTGNNKIGARHKKRKPVCDLPTGFTPLTRCIKYPWFYRYRIPHRVYSIRRTTRRFWEHFEAFFSKIFRFDTRKHSTCCFLI